MALTLIDERRIDKQWRGIAQMLDPFERTTVANALRIAADQYQKDATANAAHPRVAARFQEQCDYCNAIADRVEP